MAPEPVVFPFDRAGFRHVLLAREGDVCLVERTNLHVKPPSVHWEVIVVQHRPAEVSQRGVNYPAREAYPGNEQWGEAGWTFTKESEAHAKMALLSPHRSRTATRRAG
jgi:hypothetical protein